MEDAFNELYHEAIMCQTLSYDLHIIMRKIMTLMVKELAEKTKYTKKQ